MLRFRDINQPVVMLLEIKMCCTKVFDKCPQSVKGALVPHHLNSSNLVSNKGLSFAPLGSYTVETLLGKRKIL